MANNKYLDSNGLLYFWQKIKNTFAKITDLPTIDSALSSTSTNPVQNKVINSALAGKASTAAFTGASDDAAGSKGLVPAPAKSTTVARTALLANGTWGALAVVTSISEYKHYIGLKTGGITNSIPLIEVSSESNGLMSIADKAKLDSLTITNGVLDPSNLPSYVDDVIETYPRSGATELSSSWLSLTSGGSALTPETGKIYVLMADSTSYAANSQFRWGGSTYVRLSDGAGVSSITNAEIDTIVAS